MWLNFFFTFLLSVSLFGNTIPDVIKIRKQEVIQNIYNDPNKINNLSYQPNRVIATINCPDCDDIPKVENAGEIRTGAMGEYQIMHNGIKIRKGCYYGEHTSWMTDIIYGLSGHHEPQEERVFYEILKYIPDNGTMLEIGSYWAYYSLWFAFSVKNANNYMIDTTDFYLAVGKDNFELNNKNGTFDFGHIGYYPEHTSPQLFIDSYLESKGIDHVHVLHSDIQGAELEMLESCEQSIKKNMIDYFVISTHPVGEIYDELHYKCLEFLIQKNFHIIAEHTPSQSCSADGLIVARRKDVAGPDYVSISKY